MNRLLEASPSQQPLDLFVHFPLSEDEEMPELTTDYQLSIHAPQLRIVSSSQVCDFMFYVL